MPTRHLKISSVLRPGTYNYFDPDNFFSMSALIYSGEPFLQEQARTVIERSGAWLCIGDVEKNNKCTCERRRGFSALPALCLPSLSWLRIAAELAGP